MWDDITCQFLDRWSFGIDKLLHPTLYWLYDYLFMLQLKSTHTQKWISNSSTIYHILRYSPNIGLITSKFCGYIGSCAVLISSKCCGDRINLMAMILTSNFEYDHNLIVGIVAWSWKHWTSNRAKEDASSYEPSVNCLERSVRNNFA